MEGVRHGEVCSKLSFENRCDKDVGELGRDGLL